MFQWTVRSDQIDPDRWAKAVVQAVSNGDRPAPGRNPLWVPLACAVLTIPLAVVLGAGTVVLALVVPLALLVAVLVGLRLTGERRLAKQLRTTPSATEGFTFTADPGGTARTGPAGSDRLPWTRYRVARLDGDVITLLLDNNTVNVLPIVSLDGPESPSTVVDWLNSWIKQSAASPIPSPF